MGGGRDGTQLLAREKVVKTGGHDLPGVSVCVRGFPEREIRSAGLVGMDIYIMYPKRRVNHQQLSIPPTNSYPHSCVPALE